MPRPWAGFQGDVETDAGTLVSPTSAMGGGSAGRWSTDHVRIHRLAFAIAGLEKLSMSISDSVLRGLLRDARMESSIQGLNGEGPSPLSP